MAERYFATVGTRGNSLHHKELGTRPVAAVVCRLILILIVTIGAGGCTQSDSPPDVPLVGKWQGTFMDTPMALQLTPDGHALMGPNEAQINGSYELAADDTVALITFEEDPAVGEEDPRYWLQVWFSQQPLHAEYLDGGELLLAYAPPVASIGIPADANRDSVGALQDALEADPRVASIEASGGAQMPVVFDVILTPGTSMRDFGRWLMNLSEYSAADPAGEKKWAWVNAIGALHREEE